MRIALDARTIYRPDRRGTGKNLIDLYRQVMQLRPDIEVIAFHRWDGDIRALGVNLDPQRFQPRKIEMIGDRLDAWEQIRLPLAAWMAGADLLHCPANTCPTWMPVPTLVTIHDLIPLDGLDDTKESHKSRFAESVNAVCRKGDGAAGVICPSQYTASRLVKEHSADVTRIAVIPWASDGSLAPAARRLWTEMLNRYGIKTQNVVLHLGSGQPRKNTLRLVEAWGTLEGDVRRGWTLLIVGMDDGGADSLRRWVAEQGVSESVRIHHFVSESDLAVLMSAAKVLAYPSLSEGFGLPILDGWAVGTCVLTSDRTSLPEVAGDAAMLVDPTAASSIATGLSQLLQDETLRSELVERGRRRLKQFSWEATARQFIKVVERTAGSRALTRAA